MVYKHIYGPVPSRRLGASLGVDVFDRKTCNFNCVYCECGRNAGYVYERGYFVSPQEILAEIEDYFQRHAAPDSITFSGSGEPTLSLDLGYILKELARRYPSVRLTVLTNGSLLWDKVVQRELLAAHLVIPSLDAVTEEAYLAIDRPYKGFSLQGVLQGIAEFSRLFHGYSGKEIWLEVFVVPGVNDGAQHTRELALQVKQIRPDRIQLNALDRPPAEEWVRSASQELLASIREGLREGGVDVPIDVVRRSALRVEMSHAGQDVESAILQAVMRRPMRLEDLTTMLGLSAEQVLSHLEVLRREGRIREIVQESGVFYALV